MSAKSSGLPEVDLNVLRSPTALNAEHLRAVVNATADSIVVIDSAGRIVDVNLATEKMFGYTPQELVGNDLGVLLPLPEREDQGASVDRYLETEEASLVGVGRELTGHRRDGSTLPVEISVDEVESQSLSVVIIRDISERRQLEQEVVNAAEEERIEVARELHDSVGCLLSAIKFRTEAYRKGLDLAQVTDTSELRTIADLVQDAITQVQVLSRGLHPIGAHPEDLLVALRSLATRVDRGPGFQCHLHCPSPVTVSDETVANHLFRIAQEAVSNAIKHSNGTRIEIALMSTVDGTVLSVADNGDGIALEGGESNGLGLLTMRYRAHAINATLAIEPRKSRGTKVVCVIPQEPAERE